VSYTFLGRKIYFWEKRYLCSALCIKKTFFLSYFNELLEFLTAVISNEGAFVQILKTTDYC